MKAFWLLCVLLTATSIASCTPSEDSSPWSFVTTKDKITDALSFDLYNKSRDGKFELYISCTPRAPLQFSITSSRWLGSSNGYVPFSFRAGSKPSISQKWFTFKSVAGPSDDKSLIDLARYVGEESDLLVRMKTNDDLYDLNFNVKEFEIALAKLRKTCDGAAATEGW
jgi:hypothetical protein